MGRLQTQPMFLNLLEGNRMRIILIVLGIIVIIFNKYLSEKLIYRQNLTFHFKFGNKEIYLTRILLVIFGIIWIIFILLDIMSVIH